MKVKHVGFTPAATFALCMAALLVGFIARPTSRRALDKCKDAKAECQAALDMTLDTMRRLEEVAAEFEMQLKQCTGIVGIKHELMLWYQKECTRYCFDKKGKATR